jgi:hypothetical protein
MIYRDTHNRMAPAAVYGKDGRPLYSWRVLLLGFLEREDLLQQFHLDEPWDSPHNKQFVQQMPSVFAHPRDPNGNRQGLTHYQVFVGTDPEPEPRPPFLSRSNPLDLEPLQGWFFPGRAPLFQARGAVLSYGSFTDGASNTILAAEAADPVPWTAPQDLVYSRGSPCPGWGACSPAATTWSCGTARPASSGPAG